MRRIGLSALLVGLVTLTACAPVWRGGPPEAPAPPEAVAPGGAEVSGELLAYLEAGRWHLLRALELLRLGSRPRSRAQKSPSSSGA